MGIALSDQREPGGGRSLGATTARRGHRAKAPHHVRRNQAALAVRRSPGTYDLTTEHFGAGYNGALTVVAQDVTRAAQAQQVSATLAKCA
jgi:hypothetical protein